MRSIKVRQEVFFIDLLKIMHKRHLIFIRHGQQHALQNGANPDNAGLTSLGMKQANLTAKRLGPCELTEMYFSPLQRARDTARIIGNRFPDLPRHEVKHLREISPPYPKTHATASPTPATEVGKQLEGIVHRFFHATRGPECQEVFVAHGNLIRGLICHVMKIPRDQWLHLHVLHGSLTEFHVQQNHEIVLHSMNDVGHIPRELRTNDAG